MSSGRLVLPALRWRRESGFAHEDQGIDEALELGVGGFIVFGVGGARSDEIARLTEELRQRAGRPLLIGADLERGAGQQARRLTEIPPPRALASLDDERVIEWAGATTAREARRIGVNWVFAPDADLDIEPLNPIVQTRAFGDDPERVGRAVATWVTAAQAEGVLACPKHYPGHGRTRHDSHQVLPEVHGTLEELRRTDLRPFQSAIAAGVAAVMTAHVAYPAWDQSRLPATQSAVMLGFLRESLGFDGLVVTDALIMEGARGGAAESKAIVRAIRAGCDLLLYPGDVALTARALAQAAAEDETVARRIEESYRRYERALASLEMGRPGERRSTGTTLTAEMVADRLLERGVLRGTAPQLPQGLSLEVVDDDVGGWYAPGPSDLVLRALARHRVFEQPEGHLVVLAFAEPRAAKGRAGFGPESQARLAALVPKAALLVLFAHPRLAAEIPGQCPILCAWHRQPLMQEAVARWLERRIGVV